MQKDEDTTPNVDPRLMSEALDDVAKEATALLQPFDDKAKTVLLPLLSNPLKLAGVKLAPPTMGGAQPPGRLPAPQRR